MDPYRILIIEDDPAIGQSLLDGLQHYGFRAELCVDGHTGMHQARQHRQHLIILDIRLPDGSGFDFCRKMRQAGINQPIIMLTAQQAETDKVLGLEMGADDYMTKPFKIRDTEINPPLILSPMAGVTDISFRRLLKRRGGIGLTVRAEYKR